MEAPQIRTALEQLSQTFASRAETARIKHAPATATLEGGLICSVVGPAGEELKTDMPIAMGGDACGPNPGWLFRAALASCLTTVIAMRAACLGIELSRLDATVDSDGDNRGLLGLDDCTSAGMTGLRTTVGIAAKDCTRQQLEELVTWADKHSPVACTVREGSGNVLIVSPPQVRFGS
jgi:uncharacterized OsmC-like protein